jgi:hypothetical protein
MGPCSPSAYSIQPNIIRPVPWGPLLYWTSIQAAMRMLDKVFNLVTLRVRGGALRQVLLPEAGYVQEIGIAQFRQQLYGAVAAPVQATDLDVLEPSCSDISSRASTHILRGEGG